jgi:hypothetical protein
MTDTSKTVLSFDIGMKNLALCLLERTVDRQIRIHDWDVLNVITGSESAAISAAKPASTADIPTIKCGMCKRKAKYVDIATHTKHFCTAHKTADGHIPMTAAYTPTKLLKQSKATLETFCKTNSIEIKERILKDDLVKQCILPWLQPRLLEELIPRASATVQSDVPPYIQMGRFLDTMLRERLLPFRESVHAIVIENQMAERMRMVQGMVLQFCIGFFPQNVSIEFIAPSNKLKPVTMHPNASAAEANTETGGSVDRGSAKYRKNKKDGIVRCREWMEHQYPNTQWNTLFDKSCKKDDLADSFLQGVWYCFSV